MSIGSDLLRFSKRKIVFYDFESSNLNLQEGNLPFQASWIKADKFDIYKSDNHYLKWPNFRISKGAAMVTRFQQSWVDGGKDPEEVLNAYEKDIYDEENLIVGHSVLGFDVYLHQLWRRKFGRKPDYSYLNRIIDLNLVCRAYKEGWKPDHDNLLQWQYKCLSSPRKGIKTNLILMCKEQEIEIDTTMAHDGLYDLHKTRELYYKMINLVEI